jgi:hypothetical protein
MLFCALHASAQQGINYKAIINNSNGDVLANALVSVQFTILENGTTNVYQESHNPITDDNGIIIVNIGEGTPVSGDFNSIDWGSNPHFLMTEIDIGDGLTDMGTTEFKAVPYALYAEYGVGSIEINDLEDAKFDGSSLFVGQGAGFIDDGTANRNTALGTDALKRNTTGFDNTANGVEALQNNTEGFYNTANGNESLYYNTLGNSNTANGFRALYSNTEGSHNTANGLLSLYSNTTGHDNTANGYQALYVNTTGEGNTACGYQALSYNTTGSYNTAFGSFSLQSSLVGFRNTAVGNRALSNLNVGGNNTGIGDGAQVPNSYGSNQVRIGNNDITYAGIQVAWTITSDERWKEDIRSLPYGLDMLMNLKPVDYIRKNNEKETREMGIIAQDLEELLDEIGYEDQGFLIRDDDGLLHLRYNDLIALLIKAIQDQQALIEEQNIEIKNQKDVIESFTSELKENKENQEKINYRLNQFEELLKSAQ